MRKLTTEEWVAKAKAVHGDKYDYSRVEYIDWKTPVIIVCPIHGEFPQEPNSHVSGGRGCPECGLEKVAAKALERKKTTEEFIKEAKKRHGDYYDYSKVEYKGAKAEVIIICPEHGQFEQVARVHLKGHGCSKCAGVERKTTKAFIKDAISVHGDKYDYSQVEYVSAGVEVKIICPVHGVFHQSPRDHISRRNGCPKCAKYGFLSHEYGSLYIMVDDPEVPTMMKVGVSVDVEVRRDRVHKSAKKAGAGIPDLHVIKTWSGPTEHMQALEKAIHQALNQYKISFLVKFDGCREFFYYRPEVFELIEEHLRKFADEE